WEESGGGWSDVVLATAKGAGLDYAGGFLGDAVDGIPTIPQFADKGSTMMARLSQAAQVVVNAPQDAVKGYVEDFLKEGLSLSFDKATGKYQGDFGDVLVAMNEAGFKGAGTGMLNRFIKRVTPEKAFEGKKSEEGSTKSIGDEPGEVSELVAKHPDVVEQLDHLEASEEASSEKAKQDDADQAERIEQVGGEETPEASAQTLEEVSQEKEAMVEQRSQEGQEEIADFVEVVSETEKTVEAEVDAEAKKAQEAIDKAAAQQSLDNASAPDATPALSDEEIAHTVLESLNLSPEAGANFSSLDEQEVAALVEHHKVHGDAGRVLQDPDRLRQVVSSTREVDSTLETPVDLNTASVEELQSLHGIGPAYAKWIVEEREKRPFSSAEDMADRVSGVASVVLDDNAKRMRVSKPTSDESVAAEGPSELDAENQSSETAMFQRDSTRAGYGPKDGLESSHPRAESLHPEDLREGQKIVYQDHVVTVQRIDDQLLLIPEGDFGFFSMTTEEFYTHTGRTPPPQRLEVPNHEDNTMIIHRLTQQDTEYVSGGGDQRVVVDLEGDAALQDALAAARKASGTGSIDEQIALLTNHVHQDIEYDKQSIGADEVSKDLLKAYREAKNNNDVQAANQLAQAYRHHVADSRRQSRYDADPDGRVNLGEMVTNDAVVCREKAIFMHVALADMGIESQVVIGKVSVDNGSGAAGGHAWVVLADGTVIDGTWGAIYPGGQNYPVHSERERRVFAAPNGAVDPAEAQKGAQRASGILEDPGAISKLRTQAEDPSARGDSPSQGNTAQSVDGEEVLEPARPLRPDEMGTFYDRNGNPVKPGEVRDAKFVHPDDLRVGDRIRLDGHEMTVQSKDEVIHLMTDFQGHRFLSPEDFIRATQGDAAADYYLSDEAKTQPIARMPDGDQTRMLSLDELRKQASPSQETDAQPEESDQKRSGNQKEEVDSWTKKGLEATYSGHLQEEHLEGFRQAERAREQQILEDISNSWKALSDTDRAEALSRARKAFPNLKDESVQALEKCLQNFKNDGEFSSLPTMDGSRESAYTILNFERLLLEAAAIPEGPLLRITDGAYNQFGDARVDDQGELLKQQTYATPAGAVLDGVSVMDLTPEAYARSMGIIEDTSKWGETSSLLADYMGGGRMEGETDQQVRTRWVRAVEDQYGGFKEMKYLSVTLDAAELAQHIRYSSPHLVSGYAEVTLRPLDASDFEGLGLLDIDLSQDKTIGESLRTALAGELTKRGKPELAAEVEGMSAADLARVLKSDIADPQKLRSHLGG
ncbi:MAG: DUF655 domain-containing protein, partial [Myxococcota bacterium]|nr:DUF655 domain-containing protein [Myxococcota bacterium]